MQLQEGNIALRPLLKEDKEAMAHLLNNKKVWDNLRDVIPFPYTERDASFFISRALQATDHITFAITYEDTFVGVIGLIPQQDVYRKSMELGYWIGEPYWNKGIATAAVQLIVHYAFATMDINRVFSGVFEYNTASMKVLEKCGFVKEGVAKKAVVKNNRLWDHHLYALLKEEMS